VLHDKLVQNPDAPFFETAEHAPFRCDRISWIRRLFDMACGEYDRLGLDKEDSVGDLGAQFDKGLEGVSERQVRGELAKIERLLSDWSKSRKLYGHLYDDVLKLKYLHQRYTNYLKWLSWKA
jgi:hypothetical protein